MEGSCSSVELLLPVQNDWSLINFLSVMLMRAHNKIVSFDMFWLCGYGDDKLCDKFATWVISGANFL